jgi:hypothetical protein
MSLRGAACEKHKSNVIMYRTEFQYIGIIDRIQPYDMSHIVVKIRDLSLYTFYMRSCTGIYRNDGTLISKIKWSCIICRTGRGITVPFRILEACQSDPESIKLQVWSQSCK